MIQLMGLFMKYKLEYLGGLRTEATHLESESKIQTDAPKDNQGQGEMFSPTDLLAISLASCMMTLMGICAKKLNIDFDCATMSVEKTMALNPRRIGKISIDFSCLIVLSSEHQKMMEKAAHDCPVNKSLHPDVIVETTFKWG